MWVLRQVGSMLGGVSWWLWWIVTWCCCWCSLVDDILLVITTEKWCDAIIYLMYIELLIVCVIEIDACFFKVFIRGDSISMRWFGDVIYGENVIRWLYLYEIIWGDRWTMSIRRHGELRWGDMVYTGEVLLIFIHMWRYWWVYGGIAYHSFWMFCILRENVNHGGLTKV